MRQLDWTNCLLHLSYFLGFFSEEYAHQMHPVLRQQSQEATLRHVLDIAPKDRMVQLSLDERKLANWTNLAYSLQSSATEYEPSGMVDSLNVFCAVPLAEVARDMDDWMTNHLGKWRDFSRTQPKFHYVDGAHYTMISPAHVHTFQKTLKAALDERGI
jgi:thioesterase domain-containing protein